MLRRVLVATFLTGALAGTALAEDGPIDVKLEACLDNAMSTQDMVACNSAAYEAWDAALNEAYRALMATLSDEEATALREAQRAWIRFRDAESAFLGALLTPDRGTMMRLTVGSMMTDIVKERVLALRSLDETGDGQ